MQGKESSHGWGRNTRREGFSKAGDVQFIRRLESHSHPCRPQGPEEGTVNPFTLADRLAEYGSLLLGSKGLSYTAETEDRKPVSGVPQSGVKRFVPDARRRGG